MEQDIIFKLDRHTFVRKWHDCVYMENQVSHTRAKLPAETFGWMSAADYSCLYSMYEMFADVEDKDEVRRLLTEMERLWLVDIEGVSDVDARVFSYSRKKEVDRMFEDNSSIDAFTADFEVPMLTNLQIELTDVCNERCIHCYLPNSKKNRGRSLNVEEVKTILRQYREMQGLKVVFSGGEILLHTHLFEILEECRRLGLMILLQSNLVALTEENLQRIKMLDVFNVQVSLYSTDPAIHDEITTRRGSYELTRRNLQLLVDNDIPAMISCPVMKQNFPTVHQLHKYATDMGVDIYFDFMMMAECDGSTDNLSVRLDLDQTRRMLRFYIEQNEMFMHAITLSDSLDEALSKHYARRRTMCHILSASICIDSDGTIYPCPGWNSMKMGNIRDATLDEVWHGDMARQLRGVNIDDFEKCGKCQLANFCDICLVYNHNENGSIYNVCHRFCEMAAMLRQTVTEIYNETKMYGK